MSGGSCTLLTASKPRIVGKEFWLDKEGKLQKKTTAYVSTGQMETETFQNLEDFSNLLQSLATNQCLVYGLTPRSPIRLVPEATWNRLGKPQDKMPRSKAMMHWPAGPGILMLDYDAPKDDSPPFDKNGLLQALREAVPQFLDFELLSWPSTSSCIFHGDRELIGVKGQRIYVMVSDARDIPRAGQALLTKLWAMGYGRYEVSKSGSLLERGLFDSSVWETNHIDFAAGAECRGALEQRRGEPELIEGYLGGAMDTRNIIPGPTAEESAAAAANKAAAKAALKEAAAIAREQWSCERVSELCANAPGTDDVQARQIVKRAAERRELMSDWTIIVWDDGQERQVTIKTVLADKGKYSGMQTLDPLEPDYDGRRPVGKLYLDGAQPRLHSWAHGGTTFKLYGQQVEIEIVEGKESEATDALLQVLRDAPAVFDFGAELVTIGDAGRLMPQDEHALRYLVGGLVQFYSLHPQREGRPPRRKLENPPPSVCRSVLALRDTRRLKPLEAVISAPTVRPDGSLFCTLGYDANTHLLFDCDQTPPFVPETPTVEQARQALDRLWQPFKYFPFVGNIDRAVHLAALLTAAVRAVLPTAPAFGYDAPVQASGKTLLARSVGVLAAGSGLGVWPHTSGRNDDEVRKRLFTVLRSGTRALVWDNVTGIFDSGAMASLLTSPDYQDRILGVSVSSLVPNRVLLLMTGNNLCLAGDMARRALVARIDPKSAQPFARDFAIDPYAVCVADRQNMIAAALTLIRFYLSAGVERLGAGRMASFEQWDDWVRQTVIYVDRALDPGKFGDIMEQVKANQANDPDQEALGALLRSWQMCFGENAVTAAEVLKEAHSPFNTADASAGQLGAALEEFNPRGGDLSSKSLGRILKFRLDRVVGDLRLEQAGQRDGTMLWRVRALPDRV
ncbi:MAG: hypothetical protein V5B60_04730 [Accumulibacter sp.]|jgi:hypothetical protein|uniref:hypothetical protein n=1 Tax=Accumulibacter sp. TaxID=2053492 RepID=UPI002FC33545